MSTSDYSAEVYEALSIVISKPVTKTWWDQLDDCIMEWESVRRDDDEDMREISK